MSDQTVIKAPELDFNTPQLLRYRKVRALKDKAAEISIGMGGISVILAICLIFFYLLYEVMPMFKPAHMSQVAEYSIPGSDQLESRASSETVYLAMEEQAEKAIRVTSAGQVVFFNVKDGSLDSEQALPLPEGVRVSSFAQSAIGNHLVIAGLSDGTAIIFKHRYKMTFPNDVRVITPIIEFPYGDEPIELDTNGGAINKIVLRDSESALFVIGLNSNNALFSTYLSKEEDFLSGDVVLEESDVAMPNLNDDVVDMQLGPDLRWLYISTAHGKLDVYDLSDHEKPLLNSRVDLTDGQYQITSLELLLGGISVLASDSSGSVSQWFMVRDENNEYTLQKIRSFSHSQSPITSVASEHRRKGFIVGDEDGHISIFNATAQRMLVDEKVVEGEVNHLIIAPRANFLMFENDAGQ